MADAAAATTTEAPADAGTTQDTGRQGSLLTGGESANQGSWVDNFEPDDKQWLTQRGMSKMDREKALPELVKGYRAAESKLGVPAEQLVRLPKDENDADGLKKYMAHLGVPETPEGYEINPEDGVEPEFTAQAAKWFHEMNVPKNIAKGFYGKLKSYAESTAQAAEERFNQRADEEIGQLRDEWKGDQFDRNVELGRRVRATMGLTDEETQSVERAIGVKRAAQAFSALGKLLGEHKFHGGDTIQSRFAMSPEAARTRIVDLQKDSAWMTKYLEGDADKVAEWSRLHQIGFPEPSQT